MFINSGVLHRFLAEQRSKAILCRISFFRPNCSAKRTEEFTKSTLNRSSVPPHTFKYFPPNTHGKTKYCSFYGKYLPLQTNEADCELSTVLLLLEIWKILFDHLPSQAEAHLNNGETLRNSQLQIMMQFIHKHYCEPISLKETSSAAFLSKNTALQRFRNGIRLSPVLYMIRYRLTRAAELLLTTESSVTHIAEQVGFESAGYFCRKFKECYKISPTEYRSKKSEK